MESMSGKSVLIVDDVPTNLKLMDLVLRSEGFRVYTAADAAEALAALQSLRPDIILLDIRLPVMDGLDLTRVLRKDPRTRSIPIVAVSASAMPEDREKAMAAGCDGYITKPVDTRTLAKDVSRYLEDGEVRGEAGPAAIIPGGVALSDLELESLRRRFLESGALQARQMLESLDRDLDRAKTARLLHGWIGAAGALGYSAIAEHSRKVEDLLPALRLDPVAMREAVTDLLYAFTEPREARSAPLPAFVIQALSGIPVGMVGFDPEDQERLCAALESVGAHPRAFAPQEQPGAGAVRDCRLLIICVGSETEGSEWLSSGCLFGQPLVFAGGRQTIMDMDPSVQLRAHEFLIDGWQPEEALMRCSFAISRALSAPNLPAHSRHFPARVGKGSASDKIPQIIVADDDPTIRSIVRCTLEEVGMSCHLADKGTEALEMILAGPADAAVLDLNMPDMDGYHVLAAVRERGVEIPIVLLTARNKVTDITRGFTLGADDYVVKPFNSLELVARVKRLLHRIAASPGLADRIR